MKKIFTLLYYDPETATAYHPDSSANKITDALFLTPASNVSSWTRFAVAFNYVSAARVNYQISKKQKLSLICNNIFNVDYSLRPMKIESPRTTALQYVLTF